MKSIIICNQCRRLGTVEHKIEEVAWPQFKEMGWKHTGTEWFCPDCIKKD